MAATLAAGRAGGATAVGLLGVGAVGNPDGRVGGGVQGVEPLPGRVGPALRVPPVVQSLRALFQRASMNCVRRALRRAMASSTSPAVSESSSRAGCR